MRKIPKTYRISSDILSKLDDIHYVVNETRREQASTIDLDIKDMSKTEVLEMIIKEKWDNTV